MQTIPQSEKSGWDSTVELLGNFHVSFGSSSSVLFREDPKELVQLLSRYKFAAKMALKNGSLLELGCRDGIGATILGEFMERYVGVDSDLQALEVARQNMVESPHQKYQFLQQLETSSAPFSTIVSLHETKFEDSFFQLILENLGADGIVLIGVSKEGPRVRAELKRFFHQVFLFPPNGDTMLLGCHRKVKYD